MCHEANATELRASRDRGDEYKLDITIDAEWYQEEYAEMLMFTPKY